MTDKQPDSAFLRQLLESPDKQEALSWLNNGSGKHNLGELTPEDSIALLRHLYSCGAIEIVVVKIARHLGYSSSDYVILTLPNEPAKREAIFEWEGKHAETIGLDPSMDRGQDHFLVWFD